ncbi:hypothetical protein SAMN05414137_12867 [Streptacidiphilus jiangxiensis]|uniref:Uncharacterized protein n=2 Tax=Streptacidiphilus jiangxiensis TaxID=235985 RepID=A0A1H7YFK2_STRJI|nr:hypothetical protein SAMN05414137_12867 [Streptacidiphilus jiangxiensis]
MLAGAGVAAAAATGVALSGVASASTTTGAAPAGLTAAHAAAAAHAAPAAVSAQPNVVSVLVGQGRMGGVTWKVDLEYYRHLPKGFKVVLPPGIPTPKYTGLVCERMYLGGVRIDHQGGPWADCQPVTGPKSPLGDESLNGFSGKGTYGYRLFVGEPIPRTTAYAVMTFTDGHTYRARTVRIPGTDFAAFAIPISKGHYIRSVDTFTASGHRLTHETMWH